MRVASRSLLALFVLTVAAGLVAGPGPTSAGIIIFPPPFFLGGNDIAFASDRDGNYEDIRNERRRQLPDAADQRHSE